MSWVFRAKFLDALDAARQAGKLTLDPAVTPKAWAERRRRLLRYDWVVYAKTPLGGPAEVLEYLSRYTHRTAISNERIVAIRNGDVLVRVRADDSGGKRVIRIPGAVFIGRFLQHVLSPGFKRIRHYGVLSPAHKRERLAQARHALQVPAPSPLALEAAEEFMQRVAQKDISRCPCCEQGTMRIVAELPPDRSVVVRPHPALLRAPPAGVRRNGNEGLRIFKKVVFTRQGCARPEPCQSGCKASPSTDQVSGWPAFGLSLTSVCQKCQATTDCKPAPDLDTTQEPAY